MYSEISLNVSVCKISITNKFLILVLLEYVLTMSWINRFLSNQKWCSVFSIFNLLGQNPTLLEHNLIFGHGMKQWNILMIDLKWFVYQTSMITEKICLSDIITGISITVNTVSTYCQCVNPFIRSRAPTYMCTSNILEHMQCHFAAVIQIPVKPPNLM